MSFLLHAADVMWWSWWSGLCTLSFSDSLSSGTCQPFCWQLLMLSSRMQILVLLAASWCLWGFFVNLYRRSCSECIWHCMQPMSAVLQTWLFLLWYYKSKRRSRNCSKVTGTFGHLQFWTSCCLGSVSKSCFQSIYWSVFGHSHMWAWQLSGLTAIWASIISIALALVLWHSLECMALCVCAD